MENLKSYEEFNEAIDPATMGQSRIQVINRKVHTSDTYESLKEACGKIHEIAMSYESDTNEGHTYEGCISKAMEMLKEMMESYKK